MTELSRRRIRGLQTHTGQQGRATCYTCLRPTSYCLCQEINPFLAHCNVLLLQHPNEWRKYYSTAKLVRQSIVNSALLRGVVFEESVIKTALNDSEPLLLYPGPSSIDCEELPLNESHTIIVIDGTWDGRSCGEIQCSKNSAESRSTQHSHLDTELESSLVAGT